MEGHLMHENAHDKFFSEKRGDVIISRAIPVHSSTLGAAGECDVVEFHQDKKGVPIHGREGTYKVYPVEYKRGEPKDSDMDILQLVAQAVCLEEMLCTTVEKGYLYYGKTKHRIVVKIEDSLRQDVRSMFEEMHQMYDRRYTPKVKRTKRCNACSLKELCLPLLCQNKSAREYMEARMGDDE